MDVPQIFTNARRRTYTTVTQYPLNADTIFDLNIIYQDLCAEIRKENENYFYKRFFFDTVNYQNKYIFLPNPTTTQFSIQKIMQVSIKYQQSTYLDFQPNFFYSKGEYILRIADGLTYIAMQDFTSGLVFNPANWSQFYTGYIPAIENSFGVTDIDSYNTQSNRAFATNFPNASYGNPIYIMGQDRDAVSNLMQQALYVYPFTSEPIVQGIKIEAYATAIDLVIAGTEPNILIERNYHWALVEGLMWMIYQQQGKLQEAMNQKRIYEDAKREVLTDISERTYGPRIVVTPLLPNFEA